MLVLRAGERISSQPKRNVMNGKAKLGLEAEAQLTVEYDTRGLPRVAYPVFITLVCRNNNAVLPALDSSSLV